MTLTRVLLTLILGMSLSACGGERVTVEKVNAMIQNELTLGASTQEIEAFFEKHKLPHSYDEFRKRYQSIVRDVSPGRSIVIYVYVDEKKAYRRHEAEDAYQ